MKQEFSISFLWFDRLATGLMTFEPDGSTGRYRAVLEAKTLGAAAWLTGDRIQRYETVMEWSPQGRLRPLEHNSHVVRKKDGKRTVRTKNYRFNDHARQVEIKRIKDGKPSPVQTLSLSGQELPDDFLTAFFNFAIGVYGPVEVGAHYSIPTLSHQGETRIEADILRPEKWPRNNFFPKNGMLLKVKLDPEILDTGGGSVYALLDERGRPQRGIVENVLGLGDVRGVAH